MPNKEKFQKILDKRKKETRLNESAHPMSELTRKIMSHLLTTSKKWPDGARNKDSLFNAENIKATSTNPFNPLHSRPFDNGENFQPRTVQEEGNKELIMKPVSIEDRYIVHNQRILNANREALNPRKFAKKILKILTKKRNKS